MVANPTYGNCFVFNGRRNESEMKTTRAGAANGKHFKIDAKIRVEKHSNTEVYKKVNMRE